MTGGNRPRTVIPQDPDPSPEPVMTDEVIAAKDKTRARARRKGRAGNILAGRMMQSRRLLNTQLGINA
jgi:hypothetical protein